MSQGGGLRDPEQQKKVLSILLVALMVVVGWRVW